MLEDARKPFEIGRSIPDSPLNGLSLKWPTNRRLRANYSNNPENCPDNARGDFFLPQMVEGEDLSI